MHRDHFGRLFAALLAFASVQLVSSLPVDSAPFGSERARQNKLVKKTLPAVPARLAEALDKFPASYLDDLRLGSTSPDKRELLKRLLTSENGRGPFMEPEDDIPAQEENSVVQKRIFYGGTNQGRRGAPRFPDTNIPERSGTDAELRALLSLRDRARAIHEKINDSIKRYSEAERDQNDPQELRPEEKWDRILHGFDVE